MSERRTLAKLRRYPLRDHRGGFTALAFVALLPLMLALGAFGVDMKHHQTAQQQLQKATDAAALAGAEMLWCDGSVTGNAYTADLNYPVLKQSALAVAQLNIADGKSVSTSTPGVTIDIDVEAPKLPTLPPPITVLPPALQTLFAKVPPVLLSQVQAIFAPTVGGSTGTVRVTATMPIQNILGTILGRPVDSVTASSKAGSAGPAYSINAGQLFPIACSWLSVPTVDAPPPLLGQKIAVDVPLVLKRVGDPIVVNLSPTLTQNAAFTTFTSSTGASSFIPQVVDQYLGNIPLVVDDPGRVTPPLRIGQSVNCLFDNTSFAKVAAEGPTLRGKVLYMPVVVTNLPLGVVTGIIGPSVGGLINNVNSLATQLLGLNQVIGFVAVKVDNVTVAPTGVMTITGMIVNGQRFGSNKISTPGLLPSLLNTILGLIGISGGDLLPVVGPGQTYPLTGTQAVKLLQ